MLKYRQKDVNAVEEEIKENLIDAGCSEELIAEYESCADCGNEKKCMKLLEKHRRALLDEIHTEQKKVDCLDYLIYMKKRKK